MVKAYHNPVVMVVTGDSLVFWYGTHDNLREEGVIL